MFLKNFLKLLKALHHDIGGYRNQHVLCHALNLPVFSNLKNVVLCGINNLLLDLPEDFAEGILEIAWPFETNYSYINVLICGIMPCDYSWSVNWVSIKEVNHFCQLRLICWVLLNGSQNADLYYSDRLHLVGKENLRLAESIFNPIEVSSDIICRNDNRFSKSCKMARSFKFNNTDFPPLPFPSASKPFSSVSASFYLLLLASLFPAILILGHLNHLLLLLIHLFLVFFTFYKVIFS